MATRIVDPNLMDSPEAAHCPTDNIPSTSKLPESLPDIQQGQTNVLITLTNGLDRPPSPEPFGNEDEVRTRLAELQLSPSEIADASPREKDLVDIVLKLSTTVKPDTSQLLVQADLISSLFAERNFLVEQMANERERWEAEKQSWQRVSEALIAQKSQVGNGYARPDDLARVCQAYQIENRELRDRLTDANARLGALEVELTKLRPILLMQPFPSGVPPTMAGANHSYAYLNSLPFPAPSGASAIAAQKAEYARRQKRKQQDASDVAMKEEVAKSQAGSADTSHPSAFNAGLGSSPYAHLLSQKPIPPNSRPSSSTSVHRPHKKARTLKITAYNADARAEHLLLAARKVGNERASVMSGILMSEMERQRERERKEKPLYQSHYRSTLPPAGGSPRTPKQGHYPAHAYPMSPQHPYAYKPSAMLYPAFLPYPLPPQAPGQQGQGGGGQDATPLDSLFNAAQSMLSKDDTGARRSSSTIDNPESPRSKRRKTSGNKSALDVLADQAAVQRTQPDVPSGRVKSRNKVKGKEKSTSPRPESTKSRRGAKDRSSIEAKGMATPRLITPAAKAPGESQSIANPESTSISAQGDLSAQIPSQSESETPSSLMPAAQIVETPQVESKSIHIEPEVEDVDSTHLAFDHLQSLSLSEHTIISNESPPYSHPRPPSRIPERQTLPDVNGASTSDPTLTPVLEPPS